MEPEQLITPKTTNCVVSPPTLDLATILAIAVVAYSFSAVVHEALGRE